ncbi:putative NF-X1 finger transcription factor [Aspergillus novofumigatus IBT 16806]|uniref:R3H domain-containing protein n=1 Tax=Aspergillus novofumigatus (strain IBT 16806) TaxID=1392255 RepID=A0A2I1BZG9_ASPN1|nr:uncharacterized protein P174DRAFT_444518 [Aspergillus novofumigatus IBT 16806]PKX90776.1 hypothetical protein P174DRAFT_444518 [Aspergillus novofumigatus IBT 16806]
MSGSPVAPADNSTPRPKTARRRGRGGRGGRGSVRSIPTEPHTQPEAQEPSQAPASEASSLSIQPNESSRAARGSRGGKRGGRGGGASQDSSRRRGRGRGEESKTVSGGLGGRSFEGRLSKPERASDEDQPDDTGDLSLKADAPEFVPGAPTDSTTRKGKSKNVQPRPPKITTKSTAPDIATRIHEDIAHNLYECPICTSELGRRSRVWSCVKKWSKNEGSAAQDAARRQAEGEPSAPRAWRCPGFDPRPLPGLPPHSCGCPHPCDATCHAGPCSPCTAMGPTQDCFCGRNSSTKRCQDTDYENGWSCVKIEGRCYCGKVQTEMLCSSKDEEFESQLARGDDGTIVEWIGCFSCRDQCSRCHPQDAHPAHCPRSPDVVSHCPCGKTSLTEMPDFSPPCGKMLDCGHSCDQICHTGPCGSCRRKVPVNCRCGRTTVVTVCHQGTIEPPWCCPGEQKAIERQAMRRKLKSHLRPSDEDVEAEHICTRVCGRPLKCGRHTCPEICHKGPCNTCREAIFEDIPCNCESCPKCPFLTEKACLCGKRVCGEPLKCGSHSCQKTCHRAGDCEDASRPCQQPSLSCPYQCSEKTPCASMVTVTCGCGRLRQSRRCNAAAASKGPVPQPTRGPSLTPLTCDDECARLERNRALASALGVEINPTTTVASNITPNTLPYSTETLDFYVQLSSTSPLSTLQTYESTLHSLATSTTQRSVRFQPAKSPLRAFIHSLAADWGFASESFDPEPHRHVFVLKPTTWTPPLLGFGPENSIGIGGKSVGECVKLRERQRLKEREAQRLAAAEAKALKEAAKAQQSTDTTSDGGWAQVAASRRSNGLSSTRSTTPRGWGLPKKEKLVLRSGVGAAKKNLSTPPATEVADNWEEEEEKVEQEEEEREREREREQQSEGEEQPKLEENNEMTDARNSVEMSAEAVVSTD